MARGARSKASSPTCVTTRRSRVSSRLHATSPNSSRPRKRSATAKSASVALVHHSADLLAVIDTDGILLDPMSNQILGYPAGALVGLNTLELVHHDDLESARATLARSRAQPEQPVRVELRVRHSDGRWRRFDIVMTNHLDDPVVCGIIVNGHDVTERVDAERELARERSRVPVPRRAGERHDLPLPHHGRPRLRVRQPCLRGAHRLYARGLLRRPTS